jgi:NarL family two-component system sensor histidine kinase LiaS
LPDALAQIGREFAINSTATVDLRIEQEVSAGLSRDEVYHLMSIAREALANVAKHAQADKVTVAFGRCEDTLALTVEDNGVGFDPTGPHRWRGFGLQSIERRAQSFGGHFNLASAPGKGTRVTVCLNAHGAQQVKGWR